MKLLLVLTAVFLLCNVVLSKEEEEEGSKEETTTTTTTKETSWWSGFKTRVKTVLSRWRGDIRLLWDEVLAKAGDMRGWTTEVFESFKLKMKEWVETRKEVPDDEKNEIETFISKLKVPTDKPPKTIDP